MALVRILQYPDPRLKKQAKHVDVWDDAVQKIIDDMFETHYHADNCAALAATQLDFQDPLRITVIDYSPDKNQPLCLVNPTIVASEGEQFEYEGCMSVCSGHDIYARVKRALRVKVQAYDRMGAPIEIEAEGYFAKCLQHEIDHLNGLLYLDRLSSIKRQRLIQKIQALRKEMLKQVRNRES